MAGLHYSSEELRQLGLTFGSDVTIDRTVRFFGAEHIRLGSNVRIDCFSVLSASEPMVIGDFVHVAPHCCLFGGAGIEIHSYVGLSSRVSIYSTSDDYSGGYLSNPTVPQSFRNVVSRKVVLYPHAVVGSGSVLLPGAELGRGASVGALSLVNKKVPGLVVVSGVPARKVGMRNGERLAKLEAEHRDEVRKASHMQNVG